jgi:G3E family GTPase
VDWLVLQAAQAHKIYTGIMATMVGDEDIPDSDKTPITIITGFLGSGKTTLVNYILKEQTKWKICVVENEFGEVAIDGDLVEENLAAREDIITMDNGCVCCSIRGDLVRTFSMLNSRRKDFDAIILETTGMADPAPIIFTFNSNALIQDNFRIDSVVCLVDAKHVNIHLDEVKPEGNVNEAEHQIAFSDRILLNKLDLVDADELEDVIERIRSINCFAHLIKTERSRAPLDEILGLNSFSLDKVCEVDPLLMDEDEPEHDHEGHVHSENCGHGCTLDHDHSTGHDHSHGHEHVHDDHCGHDCHDHEHHDHDHSKCTDDHDHEHSHVHEEKPIKKKKKVHNLSLVSSVGYTIDGPLDVAKFNTFMSGLLAAKAVDLYRTKGILSFADQGDTKFVFQGVHEQIQFGPTDKPWGADEVRGSKMVFIGKNLDYEYLKASLLDCTVSPSTAKITMHKR